ncbi:SPARC isoform X2 [Salmo trutta]|uniref:SPARC isoform X2 n=1 Tax=Salmo trutta TaxID=8032 RepID=UPI001131D006|nr:SPARC-like isoform X2 [Salmo trutta]
MGAELDHKNRYLQKVCEKERKSYAAGKTQENKGNSNGGQKQVKLPAILTTMHLTMNLLCLLVLTFHPDLAMGGRSQRKQRQAEDSLRPYLGRVDPVQLCELLKCHSPMGSWCQVVQDNGVLVPKCVCPKTCPWQGAPVCSVLGKTYGNECLLHREACHKRRRIGLAHIGPCLVPKANCTEEEYGQFPYRLMDWFLLLSRMGESYAPYALPQSCLSHAQRTQLAQRRFALLDKNKDGKLSQRDLRKLRYKRMPLEQCANFFFHYENGIR